VLQTKKVHRKIINSGSAKCRKIYTDEEGRKQSQEQSLIKATDPELAFQTVCMPTLSCDYMFPVQ
jgi:hypothetical protein